MNGFLRQSTASQTRTIGPFIDDGDFKSMENGLTIANTDIRLKKNGAASVTKNSGGATADGNNGEYAVTWDATDSDTVGELHWSVLVSGALLAWGIFTVLEEAVYDALFASSAGGYATQASVDAVDTVVDAIKAKTDNLPSDPADHSLVMAEIAAVKSKTDNLPSDPADQSLVIAATTAIYDRIGAPAGASIADDIAAIDTGGGDGSTLTDIPWNPAWDAEVQSEVEDALAARFDASRPQRGQAAIPASASLMEKVDDLHKLARNKATEDATTTKIFADDGVTVDHKGTNSWDGTTFVRGEIVSGP